MNASTARNGSDPAVSARAGVLTRIATWSATHRGLAIGLWLVLVAVTFGVSMVQAPRAATEVELGVGESGQALAVADEAGYVDPVVENVLITARDGELPEQDTIEAATTLMEDLEALDEVSQAVGPIPSDDGDAVLVQVTMTGDTDTADERVEPLQDVVAEVGDDHQNLRIEEVGNASIQAEFQEWLDADLERATALSLPVTLVILLVVFGAIVMAGIPVVLAIASVASGLGLWALASQVFPDPGMVLHLLVLVGMAVGVDYSLFYLRRFREERHAGRDSQVAVRVAAATAGHSVVVSGIAVVLSMAGLYIANDTMFSAMATGAIVVVLVALVSSVTVLPAMLVGLGRWVDKPRIPFVWRLSNGDNPRLVPAILRGVLAHPAIALVASLAVLAGLAYPLLGISLKATQIEDFPRTLNTMQSYDRLVEAYPGESATDMVVAEVPAGSEDELADGIDELTAEIAAHPGGLYGDVQEVWFSDDDRTAVVQVHVPHELASSDARESVDTLREDIVPGTLGDLDGNALVGGSVAADMDYTANLDRTLPVVVGLVLVLVFVMMFVAYRSLAVALITVLLNAASLLASFGILTAVFQNEWAEGLLGFESTGHVVSWVPTLLFVVLCGLSLDYHVFVVSRIRENAVNGMAAGPAIRDGVVRTAGVVTSAAVVMIGVFSIFGALSFVELKQIGVGLAVGILLDATLIRVVTLPAVMMLCRRFLWWPGRVADRDAPLPQSAPDVEPALTR